jgi:hypothetical protein
MENSSYVLLEAPLNKKATIKFTMKLTKMNNINFLNFKIKLKKKKKKKKKMFS